MLKSGTLLLLHLRLRKENQNKRAACRISKLKNELILRAQTDQNKYILSTCFWCKSINLGIDMNALKEVFPDDFSGQIREPSKCLATVSKTETVNTCEAPKQVKDPFDLFKPVNPSELLSDFRSIKTVAEDIQKAAKICGRT